ncbi:possible activator of photopigment and puc with BLUF domain [Fulvimarina pelagi HTCC2506]|uniref:Possible activator of photopigment and puc with BLUF domain n=1 Tax=Fulvimarina pelagi HTCC2506 TaxID=314231 RepID=Q0G114_9HYPH|nr:BLUF domain-containing protein [Fulvimarina pelagi]EAU40825.1 possible activator of photopigment and puc with BLUF domain [Fulvimarina pelagi HTCC2506]
MRHITYSSIANDLNPKAFRELVADARKRNEKRGIRGVIAYDGRIITQILEGEAETVDKLFKTIRRDGRHSGVVLMSRVDVDDSQFDGFGMANMTPSEVYLLSSAIIERYGDGDNCADPLILD